jgi:DNA-binding GntR family transcriptional regulator
MSNANRLDSAEQRIDRPRSLVDMAVERIRAAIIDGRLGFGEQVSEIGLATTFGISKTPVREALLRLKLEGLVEIHPQRGSFVFSLSGQQVHELMQFRELIESAALGEAIREDRAALSRMLEDNLAAMARCEAEGKMERIPELDSDFHESILKACSNPYLRASYADVTLEQAMSAANNSVDPGGLLEYSVVYTDRALNHMSQAFQGVMRDISASCAAPMAPTPWPWFPAAAPLPWRPWRASSPAARDCLVLRNGWFSFRWSQILDMGRIATATTVLKARRTAEGAQAPFAPAPIDEVVGAIARKARRGFRAACRNRLRHRAAR